MASAVPVPGSRESPYPVYRLTPVPWQAGRSCSEHAHHLKRGQRGFQYQLSEYRATLSYFSLDGYSVPVSHPSFVVVPPGYRCNGMLEVAPVAHLDEVP